MAEISFVKNQPSFDMIIKTTEMHTGGHPVRIIESGYPVPQGKTILDKIEDLRKNHDNFRKFVICEPQGHFDMYAVLLVTPDHPDADIATIFMHNEGYATMCGHVTVSIGRYAVDRGLMRRPITSPITQVNVQTPCGLVKVCVNVDKGDKIKTSKVCFESIPCYVVQSDVELDVPLYGKVKVDVVYGGAFYAFVTAKDIGVEFGKSKASEIKAAGEVIKALTKAKVHLSHPETPAFLYGTIIVDSRDTKQEGVHTQVCIFADEETDRSPCGSGTTARVALMYYRGLLTLGEKHTFRNGLTGSEFVAWAEQEAEDAGHKGVTVKVEGQGYYCGNKTLALESGDVLGKGFLVR